MFKIPTKEEIAELDKETETLRRELAEIVDEIIKLDKDQQKIKELSPNDRRAIISAMNKLAGCFADEVTRLNSYIASCDE